MKNTSMSYYYNDRKSVAELLYGNESSRYIIITNQQSINYKPPTQPSPNYSTSSYSTNNTIYYNTTSSTNHIGDGYCRYAQLNSPNNWFS